MSDHNREINSHLCQTIFAKLDTKLNLSTIAHPKSNGQTESVNQVLEDMLRAY